MPLWLLLPLLAAVPFQARPAVVEGVVTNASGTPIAGVVIVVNKMLGVVTSGADGRFTIRHPEASWLRFTADGYVPAMRPVSSLLDNSAVVLQLAAAGPHILPLCSGALARQSSPGRLRLPSPSGVRRKTGGGVDAVFERWQYGKAQLYHGSGILWSLGFPSTTALGRLTAVDERDVRLPIPPTVGNPDAHLVVDLRGAYADGKRYRFAGVVFESVEYDEASPEEAAFFDRILDGMCYRP